jgi:hypothetical protein
VLRIFEKGEPNEVEQNMESMSEAPVIEEDVNADWMAAGKFPEVNTARITRVKLVKSALADDVYRMQQAVATLGESYPRFRESSVYRRLSALNSETVTKGYRNSDLMIKLAMQLEMLNYARSQGLVPPEVADRFGFSHLKSAEHAKEKDFMKIAKTLVAMRVRRSVLTDDSS